MLTVGFFDFALGFLPVEIKATFCLGMQFVLDWVFMFNFLGKSCGKDHYYLFCRVYRGVAAAVLSSITATLLCTVRVVRKSV